MDTLYASVEWASHNINWLGTVREIMIDENGILVKFVSTLRLKFVFQRVIYTINFHLWYFRSHQLKCQWPLQTDSQSTEQQTAYYQINTQHESRLAENSGGCVALIFFECIPLLFRGKLQHWLQIRKFSFREEFEKDENFTMRNLKFWSQTVLSAHEIIDTGYN